jgi:hypothetical protein
MNIERIVENWDKVLFKDQEYYKAESHQLY